MRISASLVGAGRGNGTPAKPKNGTTSLLRVKRGLVFFILSVTLTVINYHLISTFSRHYSDLVSAFVPASTTKHYIYLFIYFYPKTLIIKF